MAGNRGTVDTAAIDSFKAAVQANPNDVEALENLGWAYVTNGMFAEAADTCRKALAIDSGHVDSRYALALALRGLHHYDEAMQEFQKVLELIPQRITEPGRAIILSRQTRQMIEGIRQEQGATK